MIEESHEHTCCAETSEKDCQIQHVTSQEVEALQTQGMNFFQVPSMADLFS